MADSAHRYLSFTFRTQEASGQEGRTTLPPKYICQTLDDRQWERLAKEIMGYLIGKEPRAIYNFFFRDLVDGNLVWHFASAGLEAQLGDGYQRLGISSHNMASLEAFDKDIFRVLDERCFEKSKCKELRPLTKKERQVVQLLVSGKDAGTCAAEMGISLYTLRTHKRNIYKKLKIKNELELFRLADTFDRT